MCPGQNGGTPNARVTPEYIYVLSASARFNVIIMTRLSKNNQGKLKMKTLSANLITNKEKKTPSNSTQN